MRRLLAASLTFTALVLSACDSSTRTTGPAGQSAAVSGDASLTSVTPGTCTDKATLVYLVNQVFGTGSPNAKSALGKLDNLDKQVRKGNYAEARKQAYNLTDFILKKYRKGGLPGTPDQVAMLVRLVFCYAGLVFDVGDPAAAAVVFPTDPVTVVSTPDQQTGVQLPSGAVTEPTLITITPIDPAGFPIPGSGPLDTRLDQYPGYYRYQKQSDSSAPFAQPVVVGVCASPTIPAEVMARLRLGHDARAGFEITPPANADFLNCATGTASSGPGAFVRQVASLFTPKDLYAAAYTGGGVGGLASEFSDFGPVDTKLSVGGGVGGLPSEFLRMTPGPDCTTAVEAPVGSPVAAECRPTVTISTHLGTLLTGVPVAFSVTTGGGLIAPEVSGVCGTFGTSAATTTDAAGRARVCWTLGTSAGLNQLRALPAAGGDAPPGITFSPAAYTFSATANPPVGIVFDQQPAEGSVIVAGALIPVQVSVVDRNGARVEGWTGSTSLRINKNSFANGNLVFQDFTTTGTGTFDSVRITVPATGYRLEAFAYLETGMVSVVGNSFSVSSP